MMAMITMMSRIIMTSGTVAINTMGKIPAGEREGGRGSVITRTVILRLHFCENHTVKFQEISTLSHHTPQELVVHR